jgi:hypothetical protein
LEDFKGGVSGCVADEFRQGFGGGLREEQNGWSGSAESYAKDAGRVGQREKKRQEWAGFAAVRLVETVLHGGAEEIAAALGEGSYKEGGGLDVGYGVLSGIGGGEHRAGLFCGQAGGWKS